MRKATALVLASFLSFLFGGTLQLEFYGSALFSKPGDLNLVNDYYSKMTKFFYQDQYQYFEDIGRITDLTIEEEGSFPKIGYATPLGARFRFNLNDNIGISLGLDYAFGSSASSYSVILDYVEYGFENYEKSEFSNIEISYKVVAPNLQLHFILPGIAGDAVDLELTGGAGLAFANVKYGLNFKGYAETVGLYWYKTSYDFEAKGKGKGLWASAGARVNIRLVENAGIFLSGELVYCRVSKVKGDGYVDWMVEYSSGVKQSDTYEWKDEEWFISERQNSADWGEVTFEEPTNYPLYSGTKSRDFVLKLFGPRITLGFFLSF